MLPDESYKPTVYLAGKAGGPKWKIAETFADYANFVASDKGPSRHIHDIGDYKFTLEDKDQAWGLAKSQHGVEIEPIASNGYEKHDSDIFLPIPDSPSFTNYDDRVIKKWVSANILEEIRDCAFLVAYLHTPDCFGSIAEISYASAFGKPCYVSIVYPETPDNHELYIELCRPMIDAYWLVSNFDHVYCFESPIVEDSSIEHSSFYFEVKGHLLQERCESPIETKLFSQLWSFDPLIKDDFEVQYYIPEVPTRLDFAFPKQKIAIYCDGHDYHERTKEQAKRDRFQDRKLQQEGWVVLRFTGSEIHNDLDTVTDEIIKTVHLQENLQ